MQVANLWIFFFEGGAPPSAAPVTTQIAIDQPAEPEPVLALTGGYLLGD